MKALSEGLVVAVTAIVVIIVAVVVIAIFVGTTPQLLDPLSQKNICIQKGLVSCQTSQNIPPDWNVPVKIRENNQEVSKSCSELTNSCNSCGCIKTGGN